MRQSASVVWRRQPAAAISLVVMVLAMIATPLFDRGGTERRSLASVVVLGLLGVGIFSAWNVSRGRVIVVALVMMLVSFGVELLGSKTGFPFGAYEYTATLAPRVWGVPVIVPCAWTGITFISYGMFRRSPTQAWRQVVLMALSITAWDVFLDPQMVGEGYWRWASSELTFRGIPLVNYVGWFGTATVMALLMVVLCEGNGIDQQPLLPPAEDFLPLLAYVVLTVLSVIGFLVFFGDAVVALVGAIAMGCCAWRGVMHRLSHSKVVS